MNVVTTKIVQANRLNISQASNTILRFSQRAINFSAIMPKSAKISKSQVVKAPSKSTSKKATDRSSTSTTSTNSPQITDHQSRVYALLRQVPRGSVTTYAALARAAGSSPRAVGGAMRMNPFAPETPCHRCITNAGGLGGFMGDPSTAASGVNLEKKLALLRGEGVEFDEKRRIKDVGRIWDDFKV